MINLDSKFRDTVLGIRYVVEGDSGVSMFQNASSVERLRLPSAATRPSEKREQVWILDYLTVFNSFNRHPLPRWGKRTSSLHFATDPLLLRSKEMLLRNIEPAAD